GIGRQAFGIHGITMVLTADLDLSGSLVQNGLIATPMAELELIGTCAAGEREDLVAHADPEERDTPEELLHGVDGVGYCRRISRSVGKKNALGGAGENRRGIRIGG